MAPAWYPTRSPGIGKSPDLTLISVAQSGHARKAAHRGATMTDTWIDHPGPFPVASIPSYRADLLAPTPAAGVRTCATHPQPAPDDLTAVRPFAQSSGPVNGKPIQSIAKRINRRLNEVIADSLPGLGLRCPYQGTRNLRNSSSPVKADVLGLRIER